MMSDHFLVVFPRDPNAALPDSAEDIRTRLAYLTDSAESRVKTYGKLQFIDSGKNAKQIVCPACDTPISLEVWHRWMDADWHGEEGFHLHHHKMPCCGADKTLDDLAYDMPQGFAHWFVSARVADRGPLSTEEVFVLEQIAGMKLRSTAQKY